MLLERVHWHTLLLVSDIDIASYYYYRMLIIHASPACVLINVFLVDSSNIFSSNTATSTNTGIIIELL